MTTVDSRHRSGLVGADPERRWREAFLAGYALGHRHGIEDAEADMAEAWAVLARSIRRTADRIKQPVPEPSTRPQPDDSIWFTRAERESWLNSD